MCGTMPNVRKPKTTLAAWIVENRKRLDWKSEELAARLDVSDSTVRGWESGRAVSEGNLAMLERLFGVQAPGSGAVSGEDPVAEAIRQQTLVMRQQLAATRMQNALMSKLLQALAGRSGEPVDDALLDIQRQLDADALASASQSRTSDPLASPAQ